jgi:hypothetical protein
MLSRWSDFVEPASPAFSAIERRSQQACPLQAVQKRVKRSRADPISVVLQFLHHREAKDGLVHRMEQHMDADQPVEEFPLLKGHVNKYTSQSVRS